MRIVAVPPSGTSERRTSSVPSLVTVFTSVSPGLRAASASPSSARNSRNARGIQHVEVGQQRRPGGARDVAGPRRSRPPRVLPACAGTPAPPTCPAPGWAGRAARRSRSSAAAGRSGWAVRLATPFPGGRSRQASAVSLVTDRCRAGHRPNAARHRRWAASSSGASANHRASDRKSAERSDRPERRSLSRPTASMSCLIAVTAACRSSRACDGCPASRDVNQSSSPRHRFRQAVERLFLRPGQGSRGVRALGNRVGRLPARREFEQPVVASGFQARRGVPRSARRSWPGPR